LAAGLLTGSALLELLVTQAALTEAPAGVPLSPEQLDQAGLWVDLSWIRLAIDLATVTLVLLAAFVPVGEKRARGRSVTASPSASTVRRARTPGVQPRLSLAHHMPQGTASVSSQQASENSESSGRGRATGATTDAMDLIVTT
jgi:hypothetical protein